MRDTSYRIPIIRPVTNSYNYISAKDSQDLNLLNTNKNDLGNDFGDEITLGDRVALVNPDALHATGHGAGDDRFHLEGRANAEC